MNEIEEIRKRMFGRKGCLPELVRLCRTVENIETRKEVGNDVLRIKNQLASLFITLQLSPRKATGDKES